VRVIWTKRDGGSWNVEGSSEGASATTGGGGGKLVGEKGGGYEDEEEEQRDIEDESEQTDITEGIEVGEDNVV